MDKAIHKLIEIRRHRALTEERLRYLLVNAASAVTLERVKQLVFAADTADLQAFVHSMLAALNCPNIDDLDEAAVQVIQDAWNYFPHRALSGKCPAELFASGPIQAI